MQTLTSIRRRGWSGGIASLPLSFFLSLFCLLYQGHRSHCASDLDQWGLKTRRSAQGSAFWGSERCAPNFWGKIPQKLKFLGLWIGLSSLNEKKFKSLQLENYRADHDKIFTGGTRHEWGFVGGPMAHPNKSKMAATTILNFRKISITPDWIKIYAPISWEDASRPRKGDHVTKSRNRKLIHVTSSNEGLKHRPMCVDLSDYNRCLNQIWYRTQIPHYQHTGMAKFT